MRDLYLERSAHDPGLYTKDDGPSPADQWDRQLSLVLAHAQRMRDDATIELDTTPKVDSDGASFGLLLWVPSLEAFADMCEAAAKRARELAEPKPI